MKNIRHRFSVSAFLFVLLFPLTNFAEDGAEEIRQAVSVVSPYLVRIDTIGGHEKVGFELANEGTSSGWLLDRDGYVITGAFNFLHDPSSILLRFADGTKKVARKVSTDRNRMLTLLKVEDLQTNFLPPTAPEIRSKDSIVPGEPCVAVGVALSPDSPNIARGIISGKNRIWGKAIQTDAAVGPNNYGGPLIDLKGRLFGILVPLSMMSTELAAGADTYDAGIGMAIPFEDITTLLPKFKEGKDLEPGYCGFEFKENRIFTGEAVVDRIEPDSPADRAGLKIGDKITAVDNREVRSALHVMMDLMPRYVGETVSLRILRDGKEETVSITTVKQPKSPSSRPAALPIPPG